MSIDLETYSDVNITKCGAYKYAESEEFEILLFGVSVDGAPVKVYDLACGDTIPEEILTALSDENITKWAFNASCRQPPLTVIRAILSGQTGTSPAINRYAAKGSLHE